MTKDRTDVYLALDIETTGLSVSSDYILEIGWRWLDEDFTDLAGTQPQSYILEHESWADVWHALRNAPQIVKDMHNASGLIADLLRSDDGETRRRHAAEVYRLLWEEFETVRSIYGQDVRIHLLGMSAHFDAEFIKAHIGQRLFDDREGIHHRIADLSSVKLFLESANVAYPKATPGGHRVSSDNVEAQEQARIFRRMLATIPGEAF